MKKDLPLAQKIRILKAGESFMVDTAEERRKVCRIAKILYDSGAVEHSIVTRKKGEGWRVVAI